MDDDRVDMSDEKPLIGESPVDQHCFFTWFDDMHKSVQLISFLEYQPRGLLRGLCPVKAGTGASKIQYFR